MLTFSDIILLLEDQIAQLPSNDTFFFKKRAYQNVIQKIQQTYSPIEEVTESKINALPLTLNMKLRLQEWILIPKPNPRLPKTDLKKSLISIIGIGPVKAEQLIAEGVQSLADLKKKKFSKYLPESASIFLKFNPERKIPHEHMVRLQPILTNFKPASVIMVGSFRRETHFSRDFDIMIVSDKPQTLIDYENYLSKCFLGKTYRYSSGIDKTSFLIEVQKDLVYKFDVFRTPKSQKYAMLLYSTGSKLFNIRMRARAKKMGYLLNQEGLFDAMRRKIPIKSEKGFFEALEMEYLEPKDRN